MKTFSILWALWALSGIVIELAALISKETANTLSGHVWALRGTGYFSLLIALLLWLVYHFIAEGRKPH